jgi:hypothetical protein
MNQLRNVSAVDCAGVLSMFFDRILERSRRQDDRLTVAGFRFVVAFIPRILALL